jgi:predicted HAD superfamily Cof-like phosphohydrolase
MSNFDNAIKYTAEFIEKFEAPTDPHFWVGLIREEMAEVEEAAEHYAKEAADLSYVLTGFINSLTITKTDDPDFTMDPAEFNALVDRGILLVSLVGSCGDDDSKFFSDVLEAVHKSNMSKLDDDGKPIRREDGKIMKGPNYKAPNIKAILDDYLRS